MARIILIEDDNALRKQLRFALEPKHEIKEAGDRPQAIDISESFRPEIAVVDLGLPPNEQTPSEGLATAGCLIENFQTKVIILTGQTTKEAAINSLEKGCFDFLTKPIDIEKLLFSIERAELFLDTEEELKKRGMEKIEFHAEIGKGLQDIRETAEKNLILKILNETGFNVYKSAKILGVKRESLYYFMKKFNIERRSDD
jgi:DNA-binding NtrC family response regulator